MGLRTSAPWVSVAAAAALFIPGACCPLFWLQGQGSAALISARPCSNDKPASNCSSIWHCKFSVRHGKSSWAAAVKSIGYPRPKLPLAEVTALPGPAERGHLALADTWGVKIPAALPTARETELSLSQHPSLPQPNLAWHAQPARSWGFAPRGLSLESLHPMRKGLLRHHCSA